MPVRVTEQKTCLRFGNVRIPFVYVRVSTDEQSSDAQLRALREYVGNREWTNVKEYVDEGVSGSKDPRPAWNELWDAVHKGRVKVLLVHALDRLGRALPHLVKIISTCVERDITLVSYRENIDLGTASGRMIAGIFPALHWQRRVEIGRGVCGGRLPDVSYSHRRSSRPQTDRARDSVFRMRDLRLSVRVIGHDCRLLCPCVVGRPVFAVSSSVGTVCVHRLVSSQTPTDVPAPWKLDICEAPPLKN